jgi:anti-anti-sigma factor
VAAQDHPLGTAPLELSHWICPTGGAVVDLGGELDIASAEVAVSYVRDVIDRHRGPVIVDLTALTFCDARGLAALVRMAGYAEQKSCPFRLASPSPSLVKIMRITGLDRRFLASPVSALGRVPPDWADLGLRVHVDAEVDESSASTPSPARLHGRWPAQARRNLIGLARWHVKAYEFCVKHDVADGWPQAAVLTAPRHLRRQDEHHARR